MKVKVNTLKLNGNRHIGPQVREARESLGKLVPTRAKALNIAGLTSKWSGSIELMEGLNLNLINYIKALGFKKITIYL